LIEKETKMTNLMKYRAFLMAVSLIVSLASCSKTSHTTSAKVLSTTISTTNTLPGMIDWGVVELSTNTPKHLSLGDGADCTLTTTLSADGKLIIAIRSKGKTTVEDNIPGMPVGTPTQLTETMTVTSGTTIYGCYVGSKLVRFTPKLRAP
jgi:hypothetical protein